MNLLIRGRPVELGKAAYRGTHREEPFHFDLPEEHDGNRAFRMFSAESDQSGVVHSIDTAMTVLRVYQLHSPERHFELMEAVAGDDQPCVGGELLGFDISCGLCFSLLSHGLEAPAASGRDTGLEPAVLLLCRLLHNHFRPLLNDCILFAERGIAQQCLDAMMAIQRLQENLYETSEMVFEVVGMYRVDTARRSREASEL